MLLNTLRLHIINMVTYIKKKFSIQIILSFLLFLLSLLFSIYFNLFNTDWHHPLIMFVNADDLLSGYMPYKDIFITYGIITTLLHSLSLLVFGKFIMSPFLITAIFYASTFPIFYLIFRNFNFSRNISLVSTILIFLIHPSIILPWSNYIAYFFLLIGIFFLSKEKLLTKDSFFVGFFLALACLSRQTYFLSLFPILFIFFLFNFFFEKKTLEPKNQSIIFFSFIIVIVFFFIYLLLNDIFLYWKLATFEYYKGYLFENSNNLNSDFKSFLIFLFNILSPLFSNFLLSIKNLDIRFLIYGLIFFSNLFLLVYFLLKKKNSIFFFLACLSLFLFSESLRIPEIFRLSTGSIIGIIPILFFLKKNKYLKYLLGILIFILIFTWHGGKHNYSYAYYFKNSNLSSNFVKNDIFKFMKLPEEVSKFYNTLQEEIKIMKNKYVINKNFNYTSTPLVGYLSETKRYQIGSYHLKGKLENLYLKRIDIDKKKIIEEFNDIVIFYATDKNIIPAELKKNFYVYKKISYPFENLRYLLFLLPKEVKIKS